MSIERRLKALESNRRRPPLLANISSGVPSDREQLAEVLRELSDMVEGESLRRTCLALAGRVRCGKLNRRLFRDIDVLTATVLEEPEL